MLRRDWLRRDLNTLEVFVLARNDAQSTIYLLLGFIAFYAGEYTLLIIIYAIALMTSIALVYGETGSHFPEAGGSYLYVKYSMGPLIGYISAWLLALDQLIMTSYGTLDSAIYIKSILATYGVEVGIPVNVIAGILSTILFTLAFIGIRESAKAALYIAFYDIMIVSALIFIANIIYGIEFKVPEFEWEGYKPVSLLLALALASRGFTGIDSIGQLAGEARSPLIQVPKATFMLIAVMGLISFTLSVLLMSRVPYQDIGENPELALLLIAQNTPYISVIAVPLMAINIVFMMLSAALTGYVAFSRLIYMLAEENRLPPGFAHVHSKFRTPHVALLVAYLASLLFIAPGELGFIVEVYAIASLINYLLVSLSLGLMERRGRLHGGFKTPRIAGIPVSAVAGVVLISFGLLFSLLERYHVVWLLGAWLFVGFLLLAYRRLSE